MNTAHRVTTMFQYVLYFHSTSLLVMFNIVGAYISQTALIQPLIWCHVCRQEIDVESNGFVPIPSTVNSAVDGGDRCSQTKIGLYPGSGRIFHCVLPSACSHFVVFIHLHSLIITEQVFPFYTSSLLCCSSFGQEGAFTTQLVWPPKTRG